MSNATTAALPRLNHLPDLGNFYLPDNLSNSTKLAALLVNLISAAHIGKNKNLFFASFAVSLAFLFHFSKLS